MGCSRSKQNDLVEEIKSTERCSEDDESSEHNDEDIRDKYDFGKVLGSGSFGQVREIRLKGQSEVRAVKMIERDDDESEWGNQAIFVREATLLQQMKHENIVRYMDFYEDVHFLYVVMELCRGGEVFAKILELKRFSERNAAVIGQQMLRAIEYIHGLQIVHRDVKAENFMFSDTSVTSSVKMIDFGMAIRFEIGEVLTDLCGSPHYLAPELIGQRYNHLVDVWAFGVLMYLLLNGHYPHDAKNPRDIMLKILAEPIRWQTKARVSTCATNFMRCLLQPNPDKRLTATMALGHPWLRAVDDQNEAELPPEIRRSAHRKLTANRKAPDPKVDEIRNNKLAKMDKDFKQGIRHGHRLGKTPTEEAYMSRPEFVRRENKLATAPSGHRGEAPGHNAIAGSEPVQRQKIMGLFAGRKKTGEMSTPEAFAVHR